MHSPHSALLSSLIACVACSDPTETAPYWHIEQSALPGALLSVWGTDDDDIWTVGGQESTSSEPEVRHYDGRSWEKLNPGVRADLWWVFGFDPGPVYMVGESGTVLAYDGTFEKQTTPGTGTVFGIWGASPDDLWAVGGTPATPGSAFIWRNTGGAWQPAEGAPDLGIGAYFKVFGRGASDVHIVGMDGTLVHFDGAGFTVLESPTRRRLLTIHGNTDGTLAAVGGDGSGVIVETTGATYRDVSPVGAPALLGVRLDGDRGYAVGANGVVFSRTPAGWQPEETDLAVNECLHSVWIAPGGDVWAAGGDVIAPPLTRGVLLRRGR